MKLEEVCELPMGYTLYRQPNGVGGHTYYSDEVGGGVAVWDTCLVNEDTRLIAIAEERKRAVAEQMVERKRRAAIPLAVPGFESAPAAEPPADPSDAVSDVGAAGFVPDPFDGMVGG